MRQFEEEKKAREAEQRALAEAREEKLARARDLREEVVQSEKRKRERIQKRAADKKIAETIKATRESGKRRLTASEQRLHFYGSAADVAIHSDTELALQRAYRASLVTADTKWNLELDALMVKLFEIDQADELLRPEYSEFRYHKLPTKAMPAMKEKR